jgi:hypothetical protein
VAIILLLKKVLDRVRIAALLTIGNEFHWVGSEVLRELWSR